jgi:predicted transposase/invertase (TIGR01784 family)
MQLVYSKHFISRILLYWAKNYSGSINRGETYDKLVPTYTIAICDFVLFPDAPHRSHSSFKLTEDTDRSQLTDYLSIHFLELPKFSERVPLSLKEAWGLFLKDPNHAFQKELIAMDKAFKKAYEIVGTFSLDENNRAAYEAYQKVILDTASRFSEAEDTGIEKGRQVGLPEGRQEGRQEGLQEGRQVGLQEGERSGERKAALRFARALIAEGSALARISSLTGLSEQEIQALSEE